MSIQDYERARAVVDEFHELLAEHRSQSELLTKYSETVLIASGEPRDNPQAQLIRKRLRGLNDEALRRQPLIEEIALAIDPSCNPSQFKETPAIHGGWRWELAMRATQRVAGILHDIEVRSEIFGPRGPLLAANGLHPWVWNAAVDRWDSSHWTDAVNVAARAVEELTQQKLDQPNMAGADLYGKAFSISQPEPGKPRLRFTDMEEEAGDGEKSKAWISAHEGAGAFGRGCAQGIRNMHAHGTAELSEQLAIEYLASLSVLARWVDTARVVRAAPSD